MSDGWLSYTAVTPRASLQSDANNVCLVLPNVNSSGLIFHDVRLPWMVAKDEAVVRGNRSDPGAHSGATLFRPLLPPIHPHLLRHLTTPILFLPPLLCNSHTSLIQLWPLPTRYQEIHLKILQKRPLQCQLWIQGGIFFDTQ